MKNLLSLIVLFFCVATASVAQNNLQDVVYLKNGSIIRGIIMEQVPGESLTIATADGSKFVFDIKEVGKMTKEASVAQIEEKDSRDQSSDNSHRRGYKGLAELGSLIGFGHYNDVSSGIEFSTSHGGMFNSHMFLGGGVGVKVVDIDTYIDFFINPRVYFVDKKATPFFDAKIGYHVVTEGDPGGTISAALGCSFSIARRLALNASIGWEVYDSGYYRHYDTQEIFNGMHIKFGFEF